MSARERIPALPHPVCLVAALADSPVAWSRRYLDLSSNTIVSVADVAWPSSLQKVSPIACSELQSTHARAAAPLLGSIAPEPRRNGTHMACHVAIGRRPKATLQTRGAKTRCICLCPPDKYHCACICSSKKCPRDHPRAEKVRNAVGGR